MPVFIAAHAAAPQIHTVISRMGLCVLAFLLCRWTTCRHQEAAAASRESEYGYGVGAAASSWNRLFDRGQNSEDAQIVWRPRSVDDLRAIKGIGPKRMEKCASTSP